MNERVEAPGSDPDLDPPQRRPSRAVVAARVALGIVGCVALTGIAFAVDYGNRPETRQFELSGKVSVTGPVTTSELPAGFGCAGTDRVSPGAEVTVRDSAGSTLAVSRLDSGTVLGGGCTFTFSVAGVPRGHDHYQVTVGRLGGVTVTAEQAETGALLIVAA